MVHGPLSYWGKQMCGCVQRKGGGNYDLLADYLLLHAGGSSMDQNTSSFGFKSVLSKVGSILWLVFTAPGKWKRVVRNLITVVITQVNKGSYIAESMSLYCIFSTKLSDVDFFKIMLKMFIWRGYRARDISRDSQRLTIKYLEKF